MQEIGRSIGRSQYAVREKLRARGHVVKGDVKWAPEDDDFLTMHWFHTSSRRIAELMKRSEVSVVWRAKHLGLKDSKRARVALSTFCKRTGYSHSRVTIAIKKLDMHLEVVKTRTGKVQGRYLLPEQQSRVIEFLGTIPDSKRLRSRNHKGGAWGVVHEKTGRMKASECVVCKTTNYPYCAKNMCVPCYDKNRPKLNWGDERKNNRGPLPSACVACCSTENQYYCKDRCKTCYRRQYYQKTKGPTSA